MTTGLDEWEGRLSRLHPAAAVTSVAVSGYLLTCMLFVGAGLMVTNRLGGLTRWDDSVVRWLADHRSSALNTWAGYATTLADTLGIVVVLLATTILLTVLRHRWEAFLLAVAVFLELTAFLTVNAVVARPRPDVARLGSLPSTSSFPSGHTAAIVALYGGLAILASARLRHRVVGLVAWIAAFVATVAVGVARVYRGMHHPSAVVAGALLGSAALAVAVVAVKVGQRAAAERQRLHTPLAASSPNLVAGR